MDTKMRHVRWEWFVWSNYRYYSKFKCYTIWRNHVIALEQTNSSFWSGNTFYIWALKMKLDMTIFMICNSQPDEIFPQFDATTNFCRVRSTHNRVTNLRVQIPPLRTQWNQNPMQSMYNRLVFQLGYFHGMAIIFFLTKSKTTWSWATTQEVKRLNSLPIYLFRF
jgi:hypothetical protein